MSHSDDTDSESEWQDCCSVIEGDTDDLPGWDELPEWLQVKPGRQISPGTKPRSEDLEIVPPSGEKFPATAPTSAKPEQRISFLLHKAKICCVLCGETAMSIAGMPIAPHHSAWAIPQADLARAQRKISSPTANTPHRRITSIRIISTPVIGRIPTKAVGSFCKELLIADHYMDPPAGPASYHHDPGRWYVEERRRNRNRDAKMYVTTDDSDLPEMMLGSLNYRGRQLPNQYPVYMLAPYHQVENLARLVIRDRFSVVRDWWLQQLILYVSPVTLTCDDDEEEEEKVGLGARLRLSQIESTPIRNWLEQIASEDDLYEGYDEKGRWNMIGFRRVCLAIEGKTKYFMRLAEEDMSDLSDSDICDSDICNMTSPVLIVTEDIQSCASL
ncbi:hypothetical protein BP00DRAFT_444209 [Aspergillus indologenus CBS 114.80]|uniref:Uncharacterized protein n=1 Tax=Aspergillus indologenus CBS 114.80 TaxID=1450541 RepID=A0A2V5IAZ5_9EURO|nr:hypothetical protein BP00DRAFT_444209 [Aspergillus indologenus CBS 114.80]